MNTPTIETTELIEPINPIPQKQRKTPIYVVKAQLNYIERLKKKDPEGFKKKIAERNAKSRAKAKQRLVDEENENEMNKNIAID